MSSSTSFLELEQLREKPIRPAWSTQTWRSLLFAHARLNPAALAESLPKPLELDTFDGDAWVGLVAFSMERLRFWGVSYPSFLETNLRTYVRHPKYGPGVWFFSLDASRYAPCVAARSWFKLPYCHARMNLEAQQVVKAQGERLVQQRLPQVYESPVRDFEYEISFEPGANPTVAEALTFDFWALERYQLYAADLKGGLRTGRVWHEPYFVSEPSVEEFLFRSSDPRFIGLEFNHFRFCKGVSVLAYKPSILT